IQAGYSYIDNEITEGGTGMMSFGPISFALIEGNSLAGIADHNFNLSSFYELELGAGRLGLGGSLYAQSDSFISGENNFEIDAWQQVDLAAYYKWDKWKAQLNVRNVFDEEYLLTQGQVTPDIFAAIRIAPAAPTTWVASLSYEF
ncbi:MAG: TonB-dependent receptor, partial [Pseudomonadota bacterium]